MMNSTAPITAFTVSTSMAEQGARIVGRGVVNTDAPNVQTLRPLIEPEPLAALAARNVSINTAH